MIVLKKQKVTQYWTRVLRGGIRLEELTPGSSQIAVYRGRNVEPHMIVCGASISDLNHAAIEEYVKGADWTDRGSAGWVTPQMRCDDFLNASARRRMELASIY